MADDRRYSEEDVRRIFDEASKSQEDERRRLPAQDGMSLDELRRIGSEVGILPEYVERAARSLDARGVASGRKRVLGLPIGVGRTVELERRLTDEEWEALVIDLRDTFDAKGKLGGSGSFKQWTNGNLQALLEPVGDTHRLRLRTTKGSSRALMTAGGILSVLAVISAVLAFFSLGDGDSVKLGLIGVGLLTAGAVQLPWWAAQREEQMEAVAARALLVSSEEPPPSSGEPRPASGESRPASGESRPASGESRPHSAESRPGIPKSR